MEERISGTQSGFRNGLGIRETSFGIKVLVQKCREVNIIVYVCSVDFEIALNNVRNDKMLAILEKSKIDDENLRIIYNLYWLQIRLKQQFS